MFDTIGLPELLVILVIVALLFGAKKLPEVSGSLGRAISEFKRGLHQEAEPEEADKADTSRSATP